MTTAADAPTTTGWRDAALVAVAFAVTMVGTTLPTPLYPRYAASLGFGDVTTTVVFSTYAVGVIGGLVLFGHWSDQLGRRPMLLFGLGLSGLSAVVFLLPTELGWLYLGRLLSGLSAGVFTGTATATVVDLAPDPRRAGLAAAAVNMGGLGLGPVLAGVLAQYALAPTRLCFAVDLVLVVMAMGCVVAVREPVTRADVLRLRPRALRVPSPIRAVFTRAAVAGFAGFAVLGLFTAVSPAFLGEVLGHRNAALIGVVVLTVFAGSLAGQTQSERLGVHRALPLGCAVLILGMVLIATSLGAKSLPLLVVGAVVSGLGQGLSFRAGLGSVTAAGAPDERGALTSTFFVMLYIGISIPVIGEGVLASATGLVTAGVVFAALVAVLAASALVLVLRSSRTTDPAS